MSSNPKKYVTKPERVEALYFDGTVESAKEISAWVKEVVGEASYVSTQMRDRVERSSFGYLSPHTVDPQKELYIYTQIEGTIEVTSGFWLTLDEDRTWGAIGDEWFKHKYQEDKGS